MKGVYKLDIILIALGLATLVVQRFFLPLPASEPRGVKISPSGPVVASAQSPRAGGPDWELTFPEDSKYKDLTPPPGVKPNPFLEVQRIKRQNGSVRDYAGKDTDMRQLLLKHEGKDYLFVLQQQAANEMLRNELFHHYYIDPSEQNMLEGIAFYTEQLEKAKSEDAKLIYMCLRALRDYWPQERIAEVALATASRVQARAQKAATDTTNVKGYHRQVYARELRKMGSRLQNRA
ncbi:hypothetical protein [Sabulibacter ruber]|uniref:hypothetical protein n=1 Tax=Sabulibacter ruber TaxID=2811901 RepID=UPI001A9716CB|nr:hypothetical protein [Sabulibacter ruber]